jgi:hypothetical protein
MYLEGKAVLELLLVFYAAHVEVRLAESPHHGLDELGLAQLLAPAELGSRGQRFQVSVFLPVEKDGQFYHR